MRHSRSMPTCRCISPMLIPRGSAELTRTRTGSSGNTSRRGQNFPAICPIFRRLQIRLTTGRALYLDSGHRTKCFESCCFRNPWVLRGGGAIELLESLNNHQRSLEHVISGKIGFASFPGADEAFFAPRRSFIRSGVPDALIRSLVTG